MTKNNIIELFPSVIDTPLFVATKKIVTQANKSAQRKDAERGILFCLSVLEKNNVKLEIVK